MKEGSFRIAIKIMCLMQEKKESLDVDLCLELQAHIDKCTFCFAFIAFSFSSEFFFLFVFASASISLFVYRCNMYDA